MAEGPKFDQMDHYKREELGEVDYQPPRTGWMDTPVDFRPGSWIYPGKPKHLEYLGLPNPRTWSPSESATAWPHSGGAGVRARAAEANFLE